MQRRIQSLVKSVSGLVRGRDQGSSQPASRHEERSARVDLTVIGLAIKDDDRRLLTRVSDRTQWKVLFADTCDEARAALDRLKAPIVLCDRDLPGQEWRDVVDVLASSPHPTCIILISKVVDDYLWNEIVQRGGYDVLSKPLREEDVVRAVKLAWSYWNSARRTAMLPAKRSSIWGLRR